MRTVVFYPQQRVQHASLSVAGVIEVFQNESIFVQLDYTITRIGQNHPCIIGFNYSLTEVQKTF